MGPVRRIDKVQQFLEKIQKKFQENYTPGHEVTVDEIMLKFHGRFVAQQYIMPNKPIKWA